MNTGSVTARRTVGLVLAATGLATALPAQRRADTGPVGPTQRVPVDTALAWVNFRTQLNALGPSELVRAARAAQGATRDPRRAGLLSVDAARRITREVAFALARGASLTPGMFLAPDPSTLSRDAQRWHMGIEALTYNP